MPVMSRLVPATFCLTAIVTAATIAPAAARQDQRPELQRVLQADLGFLPAESDALKAGRVVARVLTTTDPEEVAIAGAMHVAVPLDYYVSRIANVGVPSPGAAPPDAGRFSRPATASDLAGWSLAPADLKAIDLCDARACAIRLSDDVLGRLRQEAGLKSTPAADAWTRGVREAIAGYVAAYQTRGASGLPSYRNGTTTINPAAALPTVRSRFSFLREPYQELLQWLDRYPADRGDRAREQFFWSLDTVMATPVLTALHLVVWPTPTPLADRVLVTEQVYSSREVDALVEVTLLAADTTPDQPGLTVVTTTRSVSVSLDGLIGAAKRSVARTKARDALAEYLTSVRTAFEHDAKR